MAPPVHRSGFVSCRLKYVKVDHNSLDFLRMVATFVDDPDFQSKMNIPVIQPVPSHAEIMLAQWLANSILSVCIYLRPEPDGPRTGATLIGFACLKHDYPSNYLGVPVTSHASITIALTREFEDSRHGYAREAVDWMVDWGFGQARLHKINAEVAKYNTRALRCFSNVGFVMEGNRVDALWQNGEWHDLVNFGMTSRD